MKANKRIRDPRRISKCKGQCRIHKATGALTTTQANTPGKRSLELSKREHHPVALLPKTVVRAD